MTMGAADPWRDLSPGDGFHVRSARGNDYEATFLGLGPDQAGLYVRMRGPNPKLGRLLPSRLDWSTFAKLLAEDVVVPGNELLVVTEAGLERRGKLAEPLDERIVLNLANGDVFSAPLSRIGAKSLRLLYRAKDLRPGDEFLVRSRSGTVYRGRVTNLDDQRVGVSLHASGERVTLRVDHLDLESLEVLIPVPVSLAGCSPHA